MKVKNKKALVTVSIMLVVAAIITYGIIWYRNRKNATAGPDPATGDASSTTGNTQTTTSNATSLPAINSWEWWAQKLGYAGLPLKYGSRGVEVIVVQEMLNLYSAGKPTWGLDDIAVDGIWGPETDTRFKLFYPGTNEVSKTLFKSDFDMLNQLAV